MTTVRHGTLSGYRNHGCRCTKCRAASAAYQAEWRARPRDPDSLRHGEASTYCNQGCRCVPCTAASAAYQQAYRQQARAS